MMPTLDLSLDVNALCELEEFVIIFLEPEKKYHDEYSNSMIIEEFLWNP